MAAEDLKHLFANEEAEKLEKAKEKQKASDSLELVGELSFNTDSMVFKNLPLDSLKESTPKAVSQSSESLDSLTSRIAELEKMVLALNVDYKVNTLVDLKLMDQKVSSLLQRVLGKSKDSRPEVMAIKKLIVETIKKAS